MKGRLPILSAAFVVARRDFFAILLSRSFLWFLCGPLFPVVILALAHGLGSHAEKSVSPPQLGIAMQSADVDAVLGAYDRLKPEFAAVLPDLTVVQRLAPGQHFDPGLALRNGKGEVAAILSGTPAAPRLTGTRGRLEDWRGPTALLAQAAKTGPDARYPSVTLVTTTTSGASQHAGELATAKGAQTLLFLLTMLLAGMVLSNLVEEKGNKIIEVLAAAIPMDAVFMGKLFAMLGISLVGIACWGSLAGAILIGGHVSLTLPTPAVGWPALFALGAIYFMLAYLLLGSVFLAIGSMATTVREVQTLSMPASMMQLVIFFLATFAVTVPGSPGEIAICLFPFSSPYAMLARAAQDPRLWPHLLAIAWQIAWVIVLIRFGARLFRKRVMKSGPAPVRKSLAARILRMIVGRSASKKPAPH
ncbi:ABC transporter permease [Novosphingobium sp. 9]|uniref:ABC transporter permease n=1 Tax=Novosphingobium sp. 9 TaxID=2025349 RepID=UPI0021B608DE|nr:ABC transporter permease [Novosphingobium sp. 9]